MGIKRKIAMFVAVRIGAVSDLLAGIADSLCATYCDCESCQGRRDGQTMRPQNPGGRMRLASLDDLMRLAQIMRDGRDGRDAHQDPFGPPRSNDDEKPN